MRNDFGEENGYMCCILEFKMGMRLLSKQFYP